MSRSKARKLVLVLSVAAGMALFGQARADDLDRFKAENEIKVQKVTAEVKAALTRAANLERTDPLKARDILRQIPGRLEDDVVLPDRQRTALLQQVRERLRLVIQAVRAREIEQEAAAQKAAARARDAQRRDAERQAPRERTPSDIVKGRIDSARSQQEAAQRLKLQKERGRVDVLSEVDRSAARMQEERITAAFVEATARRVTKLSAKEKALLKALNSVMSIDFSNAPFREVIDYLSERTGQAIILDDGSLREAMVEKDDPVTFKAKKIQVRTILRKILADRGLTYVIREGTIQVVTPQKARDYMIVRTYPVGDLVTPIQPVGPFVNFVWQQQNAQMLIDQIKGAVDPTIWEQGATIRYNPALRALLIRAPAEVHYSLGFGAGYGGK
jgi:hypothetical protein